MSAGTQITIQAHANFVAYVANQQGAAKKMRITLAMKDRFVMSITKPPPRSLPVSEPLDQASALLKMAEKIVAIGPDDETGFVPATALALLEKNRALEEADVTIYRLLLSYETASRVFNNGDALVFESDPAVIRARAFLARQGATG